MTTVLTIFILTLILSLLLTPVARRLGIKLGALDNPDARKVHNRPIPRTGGLAVFITFFLALIISKLFNTTVVNRIEITHLNILFFIGSLVIFMIGLLDDFKRQSHMLKFAVQILAASLAFWGGVRIEGFRILGLSIEFGILSYVLTIFWFVLLINAINLVDGLDGLAGGIVVFASVVMVIFSVLKNDFFTAMMFAALGGSVLGFLRYNFNPASIFLGDGGSYFLGYAIAGLSIIGSFKSQLSVILLIPLLALGVPIFDTILAPVRRFIRGKNMFAPDNGHVHHRLLAMGLTTKKAVLFIYLMTLFLCVVAVVLVNIRDERAGLFLIVLGAGVVIFIRKLGYFEYFATDKIYGWFRDLTDEAGFSHERRTFLSIQIEIGHSKSMKNMWDNVCQALRLLDFDFAALYLNTLKNNGANGYVEGHSAERRKTPVSMSSVSMRREPPDWVCSLEPITDAEQLCSRCLFRLEMQLFVKDKKNYGTLLLLKDLERSAMDNFTLKRIESLRRSMIGAFEKLEKAGKLRNNGSYSNTDSHTN
ncbi:MAG: MraY family glycosyltransferase [Thermodesulfobacteriota bacterium]